MKQIYGSITTRYALDINNSVSQELSDGSNTYLYGLGRIAQQNVVGRQYYQPDALGSVRQLVNAAGTVIQARSYEPFGKQLSAAGNPLTKYAFTGEWQDPTGLIFLRARYYDPYLNQFIQRDPIVPDYSNPQNLNAYSYVRNNPVNLTDPSGLSPITPPEPPNHRDLTYWLYNELHKNANGYYTQRIKSLLNSPSAVNKERAIAGWIFLVKDKAKWDFKHKIRNELQTESVLLRHGTGYRWYEYSIPGNIHFGFVGRAAGFSGSALHLGAGFAEVTDPAHTDRGEFVVCLCAVWV